ncbi:MAG: ATP-dependent Clp protease ATP-binding subunit, partial [Clostridia bacterium]|nr:ATP-dependent Clp protease ATP-binding subunit [Clostridia bacterium]
ELHTIIGAGAADGAIDASNILKPSLARGELQLIGATTINEYRKYIEKDAALERRFQPVHVDEPSVDDTILILKGLRDKYEAHHGVVITDEAISAAATLSARYISDRFLPDKAIDLIDEASASAKLASYTPPAALKKIEEELKQLQTEKQAAIDSQAFEKAAELRDRERAAQKLLDAKTAEWKEGRTKNRPSITEENIASVISGWMKIPVNKICEDDAQRLRHLESELHRRVVGQEEAISAVSRAIRRGRVGLKDPKRPIGSFIFLGPTGVGKTELCKALAEAMFGSEDAMIRIDMSEYMEKHSVSKMIGSPPGYVGFDENGTLTDKIRSKPYSVVLFDEIEKAHPDVFNILLQILEDGFLTDSHGRRVNFRNTVIIMTSNLGAEKISKAKTVGFVTHENADVDFNQTKEAVMQELKKAFRPELINRLDEIIVFHRLTEEELHTITRIMLDNVLRRLEANEIHATVDDSAVMLLAKAGYDPVYGARPLRRAITAKLEDLLAEKMLSNEIREGDSITIYAEDDTIKIKSE